MDRNYGLPLAFAAAAHAALLFGFSKEPRATAPRPDTTTIVCELSPPPEIEVVEVSTDEGAPRETPDAPPPTPRSAEPLPAFTTDQISFPLPIITTAFTGDVTAIVPTVAMAKPGAGGWGSGGGIIPQDFLDNAPRTRFQPAPIYPFEAKKNGQRAEVVVEFIVDEQGRVLEPRVMSSTDRMFEEPTLRAVAKWVFEPGRRNGQIVRFKMAAPVVFTLSD